MTRPNVQQATRKSTRSNPRTPNAPSGNPRQKKMTRRGIQLLKNCLEYGFKHEDCCSGCQLFFNCIPIEKKHRLTELLERRDITHTNHVYQCSQPWKKDPHLQAKNSIEQALIERQLHIIQNDNGNLGWIIEQNKLFQPTPTRPTAEQQQESRQESTPSPPTPAPRTSPGVTDEEPFSPVVFNNPSVISPSKTKRIKPVKDSYAVRSHYFKSYGHEFVVENVPLSHAVVPIAHLNRLRNAERQLNELRRQFCRERFPKNVSETTKASTHSLPSFLFHSPCTPT